MPSTLEKLRNPSEIHRDFPDRKIAGVCSAVADRLELSITVVRAAFLLLLLPPFSGIGLWLYLVIWFLTPSNPGGESGLDRVLDLFSGLLERLDRDRRPERLRDDFGEPDVDDVDRRHSARSDVHVSS